MKVIGVLFGKAPADDFMGCIVGPLILLLIIGGIITSAFGHHDSEPNPGNQRPLLGFQEQVSRSTEYNGTTPSGSVTINPEQRKRSVLNSLPEHLDAASDGKKEQLARSTHSRSSLGDLEATDEPQPVPSRSDASRSAMSDLGASGSKEESSPPQHSSHSSLGDLDQ